MGISEDKLTPGRYAAIDIGTVTCRMLVVEIDDAGCMHELSRYYRITNLGEGVDASGVLKPEAMQRVVSAVKEFLESLEGYKTSSCPQVRVIAMATSASRDAKNADEFKALLAGIGITLTVIPGQKEAALSFNGASCNFLNERLIVIDIGGGSTEVIAGCAGQELVASHSFDIGCRRVTERFFTADPPCAEEVEQARLWIKEQMEPYFEKLTQDGFVLERLVAVAGTATTVVAIREEMDVYDTARVHKAVVTREELDDVFSLLWNVSLEQRQQIVGLDPARGPVIVAGMIILQGILDLAGVESFTVSESDILHGIIFDINEF